ncbi:MAG TPA: dihydroorotate dehydrogenase-like protein [Thermoanaerobaculia bacterium]|nr:dihydroorotate dehydrogenase-like protein [Thermoanaerobaculia bacterium]
MDLTTRYLGLRLKHPLIVGASPMVDDIGTVRRLEDAGAAAIVLHSLFEEQITREQLASVHAFEEHAESFAEATSYFPSPEGLPAGADTYLELIRKVKAAVEVPVIASLNGATDGGWLHYARQMEDAGADALELNVYALATDLYESGESIERRTIAMLHSVKSAVAIPVAVKLSPYYTSFAYFAQRLAREGADGLVLFNRFYQPDLDIENLEVQRALRLSDSSELLLRLRWLAILSGRVSSSLAATGGVHNALDVIKAMMAGADAVQMVSALLKHGPEYLRLVLDDLAGWMHEHGYYSIEQMKGSLSLARCPDPAAYERANYVQILQTWRAPAGW